MKIADLVAIDVHTHAEVSCRQPHDEVWAPFDAAASSNILRCDSDQSRSNPALRDVCTHRRGPILFESVPAPPLAGLLSMLRLELDLELVEQERKHVHRLFDPFRQSGSGAVA